MQFYEPLTMFSFLGKKTPGRWKDPVEWYEGILNGQKVKRTFTVNDITTCYAEQAWYGFGKPYYKVFPHMAEAMSEVDIDIPVAELRFPYPTFMILLADDHRNTLNEPGSNRLKQIMVHDFRVEKISGTRFGYNIGCKNGANRAFEVAYSFDKTDEVGTPDQYTYFMSLDNDAGTLERFFQVSYESSSSIADLEKIKSHDCYYPSKELIHKILRVAIATCFFGIDKHEVVMPDLPRRKIERRAAQRRISPTEALKQMAREINQTKMWTIGREVGLPTPEIYRKQVDSNDPERHELGYAYMRRGHMRLQKVGKGRKHTKMVFVHPHVVRRIFRGRRPADTGYRTQVLLRKKKENERQTRE